MKKMTKLLACLLSVTMLAGCGAGGSEQNNAGAGASAVQGENSETAQSEGGGKQLRFLDVNPGVLRTAYFEDMFEKFKEETGIEVIYESVPLDDCANRITIQGTSNTLPDVITTMDSLLGQLIPAGWIIPLDEYVNDSRDEYVDVINKVIFEQQEEQYGNLYTVPDGVMVQGVFVRKDWCEDIGYELNYNWDYNEYFDLIEKLTDEEQNHYGIAFRGGRNGINPFLYYLETFNGGRSYDEEGNSILLNADTPGHFEDFCVPYMKGWAPKDSINWSFAEMVDNFVGGLAGTLLNDSEVAATLNENMTADQWTVLPVPRSTADGKLYNYVNCPYSYAITDDSQYPAEAWQLIDFLQRPENNMEYCRAAGTCPVKKAVGDDPDYGPGGIYEVFVNQLNDPDLVIPCGWGAFDFTDMQQGTFHEEMQKYLLGEKSAQDVMTELGTELTSRMKQYLADNPGTEVQKPMSVN